MLVGSHPATGSGSSSTDSQGFASLGSGDFKFASFGSGEFSFLPLAHDGAAAGGSATGCNDRGGASAATYRGNFGGKRNQEDAALRSRGSYASGSDLVDVRLLFPGVSYFVDHLSTCLAVVVYSLLHSLK